MCVKKNNNKTKQKNYHKLIIVAFVVEQNETNVFITGTVGSIIVWQNSVAIDEL